MAPLPVVVARLVVVADAAGAAQHLLPRLAVVADVAGEHLLLLLLQRLAAAEIRLMAAQVRRGV